MKDLEQRVFSLYNKIDLIIINPLLKLSLILFLCQNLREEYYFCVKMQFYVTY